MRYETVRLEEKLVKMSHYSIADPHVRVDSINERAAASVKKFYSTPPRMNG